LRILLITQRVDEDHDILGFVIGWIRALEAAAGGVEVVAQWVGKHSFTEPIRIHSLGKERGAGKAAQLVTLQRTLIDGLLRHRRFDVVLCHMCPEYVPLCTPVAFAAGAPVYLWYTHGVASRALRAATFLARSVLTASDASFPFRHSKVVPVGHGIDTIKFAPAPLPCGDHRTVVSIGRLSPVKNHQLVVRAFAQVLRNTGRTDLKLEIVGGAPLAGQELVRVELEHLIDELGIRDSVDLVGSVPYRDVHSRLVAGHIFVSASRTGSLDKAILEAMACARPVMTSNPSFATELEEFREHLIFPPEDCDELAQQLEKLLELPTAELAELGSRLAGRIADRHDLASFGHRLLRALQT